MGIPEIQITGEMMRVPFELFDLDHYGLFLRCKKLPEYQLEFDAERETYAITAPARFAHLIGATPARTETIGLELADFLFDYQRFIVRTALEARRYAVWADCGLGKTLIFLEWARQVAHRTRGRVTIFSPLQIIGQTIEEARRFYGDEYLIEGLESRQDLVRFCQGGRGVGIVNYEKIIPGVINELRMCSGVVLDEASILKTQGGTIKWNLMKSTYGVEYKLPLTATPAPNDVFEYLSQAGFLDKFNDNSGEGAFLASFFTRDKSNEWVLKPHAKEAFYRFMCSWSIYLRSPAAYGFKDQRRYAHHWARTPRSAVASASPLRRVSMGSCAAKSTPLICS
jgi:hypothetical protein